MANNDTISRRRRIDRRTFLASVGTGVAVGLAGCSEGEGNGKGQGGPTQGKETPTGPASKAKRTKGGTPILGMPNAPNNLNILKTSSAYALDILDMIYSSGTLAHPDTGKPIPWLMKDWTLHEKNVGTEKPTVVANLRDDITFNDGKPVTAEDVKFTVEYVKEQQPGGTISAVQFENVADVKIDKKKGTRVEYYFSQKDAGWLSEVVGTVILPKHVWKDVADYATYSPRKEGEKGIVGAGPMILNKYNWESWFELKMRPDDEIPWNEAEYTTWLADEGPFIDALRIEVFGSRNALFRALLAGNIDQSYGTAPINKALKATKQSSLDVKKSQEDGWHHHSFNTRRVPLDDPVFRQFLVKALDQTWVIEELYKGIGAQYGDYGTPKAYQDWRPPVPSKIEGDYEGIPIPDLTYPGTESGYHVDPATTDALRSFLLENPDAKHDYSLGKAVSKQVTSSDGKSIYVNGKPLIDAHTDNNGNSLHKPLVMSYNSPNKEPKSNAIASQWVDALNKIGVPTTTSITAFNAQLTQVYSREDFDMYGMGWTRRPWINTYHIEFFSSKGADGPNEQITAQKFNAMGYTGADDLIFEQASLMDPQQRMPIVRKILAKIYHDAPTLITHYARVLQPVTTRFGGRVTAVGGVTNLHSWLNMYKRTQQ
jgi:peptide/nickel transport system substrate-binding protein